MLPGTEKPSAPSADSPSGSAAPAAPAALALVPVVGSASAESPAASAAPAAPAAAAAEPAEPEKHERKLGGSALALFAWAMKVQVKTLEESLWNMTLEEARESLRDMVDMCELNEGIRGYLVGKPKRQFEARPNHTRKDAPAPGTKRKKLPTPELPLLKVVSSRHFSYVLDTSHAC